MVGEYPEYENCYIPTTYEQLVEDCRDGARILFDDGLIVAEAVERDRGVYKRHPTKGPLFAL